MENFKQDMDYYLMIKDELEDQEGKELSKQDKLTSLLLYDRMVELHNKLENILKYGKGN